MSKRMFAWSVALWCIFAADAALASGEQAWKQGLSLYKAYQFSQAIPWLQKATQVPPSSWSAAQKARAYVLLSLCHFQTIQSGRAKAAYAKALALDPGVSLPSKLASHVKAHYQKLRRQLLAPARRRPKVRPRPNPRRRIPRAPRPRPLPRPRPGFPHAASLVVVGLSLAAIGGAIGLGLLSQQSQAQTQSLLSQRKDARSIDEEHQRAFQSGLGATVLWIVGGAGLATGAGLFVVELLRKK